MIKVNCKNCGNEFLAKPYDISRGWGQFCCKGCATQYRNWKENNPNWRGGLSKDNYHYKRIQLARYPERTKARNCLSQAIKTGRIIRGACEICGTMDNVQAHHEDYTKPLDVRWLCKTHHREIHNKQSMALNIAG